MYSKLTSIEGRAGRKADGQRGRAAGGAALTNVSADNLGAVIKILSRWEVKRKDFNKTPARPCPPTRGVPPLPASFPMFPFFFVVVVAVFGGLGGDATQTFLGGKSDPGQHLGGLDPGGAGVLLLGDDGQRGPDAAVFVPRLPAQEKAGTGVRIGPRWLPRAPTLCFSVSGTSSCCSRNFS